MIYRSYGRGNEKFSEIGYGGEHIDGLPENEAISVIEKVVESGINILDIFMAGPAIRSQFGKALEGKRKDVYIQGHIGSTWQDEQYVRSRNIDEIKIAFEDLLTRLKTDYIDFGLIHYIDSEENYNEVFDKGSFKYAEELKKQGVIKHLGFSSHNPLISQKLIETGYFDLLLFSINPAFDMDPISKDDLDMLFEFSGAKSGNVIIDPARQKLYNSCAAQGIGITVMKTLGAGHLLNADSSPFGKALTIPQCMKYALDRPGVVSVLLGCRSVAEVEEVMKYYSYIDEEKDYSSIISNLTVETDGKCMYCNHCLPCSSGIDVAAVNKYYDLALAGSGKNIPASVKDHYMSLTKHASDCTSCGACVPNCPFGIDIPTRMNEAAALFGI